MPGSFSPCGPVSGGCTGGEMRAGGTDCAKTVEKQRRTRAPNGRRGHMRLWLPRQGVYAGPRELEIAYDARMSDRQRFRALLEPSGDNLKWIIARVPFA